MAKRNVSGRLAGYYREDREDVHVQEEEDCLVVGDGEMEEGVYVVERVVERRRKKV